MSTPEWRPRPDDDLVEPLFGGLRAAEDVPPKAKRRPVLLWIVLTVLAALLVP